MHRKISTFQALMFALTQFFLSSPTTDVFKYYYYFYDFIDFVFYFLLSIKHFLPKCYSNDMRRRTKKENTIYRK